MKAYDQQLLLCNGFVPSDGKDCWYRFDRDGLISVCFDEYTGTLMLILGEAEDITHFTDARELLEHLR